MSKFELVEGSLGHQIFMEKYSYPGETTWKECARRVARAAADPEFPEEREKVEKSFFSAINSGDFCPGGRILFGSGRSNQNMLNCYLLDPEDNVESIGKTISDMYRISCGGGGIGFNFSKIRPRGDDIQNIRNCAPGSISTMKMINEIGEHVRAGRSRRTALMAILNVSHPDFLEFLSVKLDRKELNNFNVSVAITNRFLEAVENNEEWYFSFGGRQNKYYLYTVKRVSELGDQIVEIVAKNEEDAIGRAQYSRLIHFNDTFIEPAKKVIMAKDLWTRLIDNAVESGEPGIFNIDFANEYTNVSYFEDMPGTNPCGEEVLPAYGNCCLGHINLSNMFDEEGKVDWGRLRRTIKTGVRFLDNVLTANHYPIPECKEVGGRSRRIGLGITGLHYFLIKSGYRYGSEDCLDEVSRLFETIRNEAYKASMNLAKDKGSFPEYDWSHLKNEKFFKTLPHHIRADIKKNGLRNAVLLTVAPTGTISMVLGVSTGLEPIFAPVYKRRWRTGSEGVMNETIVMDTLYKEYLTEGKDGSHIIGAYDVTPEEHIKMQSTVQRYIDSAVSKTCNLPENFTPDALYDDLLTYAAELKGFTFYRAGSRGNEPLEALDPTVLDLPALLEGRIESRVEFVNGCVSGLCDL